MQNPPVYVPERVWVAECEESSKVWVALALRSYFPLVYFHLYSFQIGRLSDLEY